MGRQHVAERKTEEETNDLKTSGVGMTKRTCAGRREGTTCLEGRREKERTYALGAAEDDTVDTLNLFEAELAKRCSE